jgi:hypothetical protein
MMEKVFAGVLWRSVLVFIDDIIVFSRDIPDHLSHLRETFERCRQHHIQLAPQKCYIAYQGLEYLGFRISGRGIEPSPAKLKAVQEAPTPTNVRRVRSFLGLASYYGRFVPRFAEVARPLNWLVKKNVEWTWGEKQESAFQEPKKR